MYYVYHGVTQDTEKAVELQTMNSLSVTPW